MVPNRPNMTTIICRKFPRMGAHWKPRKSKICLSNAESCNKAERVHEHLTQAPADHFNLGFTAGEGCSQFESQSQTPASLRLWCPFHVLLYATSLRKHTKITLSIMTSSVHRLGELEIYS